MSIEPKNIYIGLIDFFSILMPGAALTYLLEEDLQRLFLYNPNHQFGEVEGWAVFFFSSYLLGHFIFLGGSLLDEIYDTIRNATSANQVVRLEKGERLSPRLARWLAALIFKKENNQALNLAVKIKEYYLDRLLGSSAINAFQWGKARLALEAPEAAMTVQRFEADSKFFRSLFVVLLILFFCGVAKSWPVITLVVIPFLALASFWRYVEQRLKSTNQVYWYIITQESLQKNGFRQAVLVQENGLTHAVVLPPVEGPDGVPSGSGQPGSSNLGSANRAY